MGMNYLKAMIIFQLVVGLLVPIMNGWHMDWILLAGDFTLFILKI